MTFIKLTSRATGSDLWINFEKITCMSPYYKSLGSHDYTEVDTIKYTYPVRETPEQIIKLIEEIK